MCVNVALPTVDATLMTVIYWTDVACSVYSRGHRDSVVNLSGAVGANHESPSPSRPKGRSLLVIVCEIGVRQCPEAQCVPRVRDGLSCQSTPRTIVGRRSAVTGHTAVCARLSRAHLPNKAHLQSKMCPFSDRPAVTGHIPRSTMPGDADKPAVTLHVHNPHYSSALCRSMERKNEVGVFK